MKKKRIKKYDPSKTYNRKSKVPREARYVKANYIRKKFDITDHTLNTWRKQGCPCLRISPKAFRYDPEAIRMWLSKTKRKPGDYAHGDPATVPLRFDTTSDEVILPQFTKEMRKELGMEEENE